MVSHPGRTHHALLLLLIMSSYDQLILILKSISESTKANTIGAVLKKLNHFGFSLIALLLVLPFMQPIPVGPISVIGGMTFAALGLQLLKQQKIPVLPQKILNISLQQHHWQKITQVCMFIIKVSKKITRPRLKNLVSSGLGLKCEGFVLIAGGLLMAIPFGVLPLNNFFPGLAILFAALAQFEQDGLFILISFFWLIFSVFYFALFFLGIYLLGSEGINYLPEWLAHWT